MPDYKEMYLEMVRETEKALDILINVQRKCEEKYIEASEPEVKVLPLSGEAKLKAKLDLKIQ